jgi:acetylornithine deacetylase
VDGDKLYGRGTTDCLGHVALFTDMFAQLAETKPDLNVAITAVFIARYTCTRR